MLVDNGIYTCRKLLVVDFLERVPTASCMRRRLSFPEFKGCSLWRSKTLGERPIINALICQAFEIQNTVKLQYLILYIFLLYHYIFTLGGLDEN